ncbi:hypothetical protein MLD63_02995 (plasmid) [Paracoccus sp. TK19116]|uniref:Autotransporter domain-containing protein n=1 Tax=Paracoccus albicereus TaxID=2922394 RepID=A0ABT1MM95_9RHOB|nr:hypothetical protein [Paracoccus albicereus]
MTDKRCGFGYLLRSTALVGVALCTLSLNDPASAETLYYDFNDPGNSAAQPQSNGTWNTNPGNQAWLDKGLLGGNKSFEDGDDAVFGFDGTPAGPISLNLGENINVSSITVTNGSFVITNTSGSTLSSEGSSLRLIDVQSGASLDLAPALSGRFALDVEGELGLRGQSSGIERATIGGSGTLSLRGNTAIGNTAGTSAAVNNVFNSGTIRAVGGNRVLTVTGGFVNENGGVLEGVGAGNTLTLRAGSILLRDGSTLLGQTYLEGDIVNGADFDLGAHVPMMAGDLVNVASGDLTVGSAVAGNGNDLDNSGSLDVSAGLTDLGAFTNDGNVTIGAGGTLAASTIEHRVGAGSFTSAGTLTGAVTLRSNATLSNRVNGSLTITQGETVVADDLTVSGGGGGFDVNGESGALRLADGATLTAGVVRSTNSVTFGSGSAIDGTLRLAGNGVAFGTGAVSGNLEMFGTSGINTASNLDVAGRLINARTADTNLSALGNINVSTIENQARLNIDTATTAVVIGTTGTISVTADVGGNIRSNATLQLNGTGRAIALTDGLDIDGGRTTVTGDVSVQGGTLAAIDVASGGTLAIEGNLQTPGRIRNDGGAITLGQSGSINANLVLGLGGTTTLAGTVTGAIEMTSAGTLLLDGATLNGALRNGGTVNMVGAPRSGTTIRLNNGLTNTGNATIGAGNQRARIDGAVENDGTLNLIGDLTGTLANRGNATIRGTVAALSNSGTLDLTGAISSGFVNQGTATLNNTNVAGALRNQGTITLAGDVQATTLTNANDLTVARGAVVTIGDPTTSVPLNNNGTLRIDGTVANRIDNSGRLTLGTTGTVARNLVNRGTADLAGNVGAAVLNEASGTATLSDGLRVNGRMVNAGSATVADGATATVAGGVDNTTGTLAVRGTLQADVDNSGTLALATDGMVRGDVDNAAGGTLIGNGEIIGDVVNLGTVRLAADMVVGGDFSNQNLLTQSVNDTRLIVGGVFSNSGDITTGGFDRMTITADAVSITDASRVGAGVVLDADILVEGVLIYDEPQTIERNLEIADTGTLIVSAPVTGGGDAIIENDGDLNVGATGRLTDLARLQNRGETTVARGGTIASDVIVNASGGRITNAGAMAGLVRNDNGASLTSTGSIVGRVVNAGSATLGGSVSQTITNTATGTLAVTGPLRVGSLANTGRVAVGARGTLTATGGIENAAGGTLVSRGTLIGRLDNVGLATLSGNARGRITNGNGGTIAVDRVLNASGGMVNQIGSDLTVGGAATLRGQVANAGDIALRGTIDGDMSNRGRVRLGGAVSGDVDNQGGTILTTGDARISGRLTNRSEPAGPIGSPSAPGDPALLRVNAGDRMIVDGGTTNGAGSRIEVLGRMDSDIRNAGVLVGSGLIAGDVVSTGTAVLEGTIQGDLTFSGGLLDLTDDLAVSGNVELQRDYQLEAGRTLSAARVINAAGAQLDLQGMMQAQLVNRGTTSFGASATLTGLNNASGGILSVSGDRVIDGDVRNDGTIDLTNGDDSDTLRINGGLSGTGAYKLDLDLEANGGRGGSDLIVVRGGAVTGELLFEFDLASAPAEITGSSILILDADGDVAGNDYTVTSTNLPPATEQTIYALRRIDDDVYMAALANPALGSIAGNIVLTQSLIGSVINRPTSPFVQGYAIPEEEACGAGAWARATAGRADATGSSSNGEFQIESSISTRYRGIQFGGDLACFQGRIRGWDMAAGVIGGVNDGSTNQPIFLQDPNSPEQSTDIVASVNDAEFRQVYGGAYLTASRGPLNADLQLRRERTDFTISNTPQITGSDGLRLSDAEFESSATTLSGSLSYAIPIPQREGLIFVPTAGFAFTDTSTDAITFDDGSILRIKDSKSRVGFLGGTLSKSRILDGGISAVNYFATGTAYKDFSDDTESTFTRFDDDGSVASVDELSSDNLGVYGELSLGVNYLRVLEPGTAMRPRQFNASLRVDGRTGETLDSYGVTAQVRLQF